LREREINACAGAWAADLYALAGGAESGKRVETDKAVYAMTVSPLLLDRYDYRRRTGTGRRGACAAAPWAPLASDQYILFRVQLDSGSELPPRLVVEYRR
jgi:hypothetical protein